MRKLKKWRKLSRETGQRKALLKNLSVELFLHQKIRTTEAKAKDLKVFTEKIITKAKKNTLAARKDLLKIFPESIVKKLISEIAVNYKERKGGCLRIIKLNPRKSDGAKMAVIELIK